MLHDIADRRGKKAMANQTKHVLHAMFKWAKQPGRKFVTVNPFADLPAPGGANVTARPLPDRRRNPAGLARARRAGTVQRVARCRDRLAPDPRDGGAARHGARHGRQRASRSARPERTRSALVAASRADEGGSAFITPLSRLALELLRPHLKADPAAPLFDLRRNDLHEAAQRIVAGLGMERWTPHDLRRTAATILDREGYSLEQIGALLAHTRKGVTAVYARWDKFDLRREMATVVERSLRETLDGEPAAAIRRLDGNRRNSTTRGRPCAAPFFCPPMCPIAVPWQRNFRNDINGKARLCPRSDPCELALFGFRMNAIHSGCVSLLTPRRRRTQHGAENVDQTRRKRHLHLHPRNFPHRGVHREDDDRWSCAQQYQYVRRDRYVRQRQPNTSP